MSERERSLDGTWRVERQSGLLVPGFSKRIADGRGMTSFLGIPIGAFRIETMLKGEGTAIARYDLDYTRWPVVDELRPAAPAEQGVPVWLGTGRIFGRVFCHFTMRPRARGRPRVDGPR